MQAIIIFLLHLLVASVSQASALTIAAPTPTSLGTPTRSTVPFSSPIHSKCHDNGRNLTSTNTASVARVTPAPTGGVFFEPGGTIGTGTGAAVAKFRQTTYYTCVTWPSTVHCGWHEPIVDASLNTAPHYANGRRMAIGAGLSAMVVAALGM